jgi:tetraacyldisaccharide 4'-kinase
VSPGAASSFAQRLQRAWLARGPLAIAMLPLAALFGVASGLRRGLYRIGVLRPTRLAVPVVVVGNLVAGGAGKTPTVIALVAALRRRGHVPGIVSRGYGGSHRGVLEVTRETAASVCGDEPLLMHLRTGAPLVVAADRVAAAARLVQAHPQVDVIVSDDGLQYLALARDAQVLVFDERGAGNGWLLPAGPLREALPRAVPPRTLVLYNAVAPTTALTGSVVQRRLVGAVALGAWWRGAPATAAALDALRVNTSTGSSAGAGVGAGTSALVAAAGVARPERFFAMLRERGLAFEPLELPDHHGYASLPWPPSTHDVIVTEKDAIKLDPARMGATRVWVAPLDFAFDGAFESALFGLLPPPGTRHGNTPA